ncbi:MAG: glycosyltransferase [Candidatus Lokiarchaeota archaeon]|nr:glycosyltransferase [Candidatus Lokiarchaeota archaeon]MBD3342945.1 glycosyltransferase [Candidatus Lokiarchaeota archaeon]
MSVDFEIFNKVHRETLLNYKFKKKFFNKGEENYKMVLFCGYKNYEKGAISILKAIPYVLEEIKKVYFVFIGPSTIAFNRELSNILKIEKVKVLNFTPDNLKGYFDKIKLTAFKEADLFLMPSRSDAFGIAFLEAWSANLPVIGANIGATPEVINNNSDGLLVEFDNPKDIAEKIIKILTNFKLKKRLAMNGKNKVEKLYTWDIVAQKTNFLYQKVINSTQIN